MKREPTFRPPAPRTVEERLAVLEQQVADMRATKKSGSAWRITFVVIAVITSPYWFGALIQWWGGA